MIGEIAESDFVADLVRVAGVALLGRKPVAACDLEALVEGIDEKDREARAGAVAAAAFSAVCEQYDALKKAIRGGGATADGAYSQPWKN